MTNRQMQMIGADLYIVGVAIAYLFTVWFDIPRDNQFKHLFFENDTIGVMLSAVGMFLFFLYTDVNSPALRRFFNFLGDRTFAIYLLHCPLS